MIASAPIHGWRQVEWWLNRYQTLVAGLVAVLAALVSLRGVQRQIEAAYDIEEAKRLREEAGARALLPSALGDLMGYLERCAELLASCREPGNGLQLVHLPAFPDSVMPLLRNSVAAVGRERAAELTGVLSAIQVFRARFDRGFEAGSSRQQQCEWDLFGLFIRVERLFPFAREGAAEATMSRQECEHAAFLLRLPVIPGSLVDAYLDNLDDKSSVTPPRASVS